MDRHSTQMAADSIDGALLTTPISDEAFQNPSFDPVEYLNSTLPLWSSTPSRTQTPTTSSLADLATHTQDLLSHLNSALTRLSATLNQLTDEILRSGGRLAYEVEVLQGDTASLSDVLGNGLRQDLQLFIPGGLPQGRAFGNAVINGDDGSVSADIEKPEYISRLQTLTHVRARLQDVVKVFHEAMEWQLQPSELSRSSITSVTAPESVADVQVREEKGQAFVEKLRDEVTSLVEQAVDTGDKETMQLAFKRAEQLRELAVVWKGTVEERPRVKFVDSLWKMIQDRS